MADVFTPDHPCQRVLAKFLSVPVFVSTTVLDDARQRLLQPKRPARSTNALDAVCDAWLRLRGVARAPSSAELLDTRSKLFVALWERTHWIIESSVLVGLHPDCNPIRPASELSDLFTMWSEYATARKRRGDLLRIAVKALDKSLREAISVKTAHGAAPRLDPELCFEPSVPIYPLTSSN